MTASDCLRVEVGLGSTPATPLSSIAWTDITGDVLLPRSVTFNRGRGSQESGATPGRLTLTLNNEWAALDRTNLAPYPSAESGTTGWTNNSNATVGTTSSWSASGSNALTVTSVASGNASVRTTTTNIPVTAGESYAFSVRVRSATASRSARVQVSWYTGGGSLVSSSTSTSSTTSTSTDVTASIVATAPATAATAIVFLVILGTSAGGEVHYFDGLLIERATEVRSYFDGSTPGYEWTGTAHASTSRTATSLRRGRWTRGGSNCTVGWGLRVPIRTLYALPINGTFESSAAGWQALAACTIARSTMYAHTGSASLALTATSAADMSAILYGIEVLPSQTYLARARIRASAASRTGYVSVAWFTSGAAYISSSTGTPAALTSGSWVEVSLEATAPSTAAFAAVEVHEATPAIGEVAHVDTVSLALPQWLGYVDAAPPKWENGVRPVVEVSATDRLARFQQRKLTSLAVGEVLYDDPAAFFPLSESATSATVGDTSGNHAGTLGLITCGSPTNATFEMGSAEVPGGDGITSAGFVPDNDRNGYALAGDLTGMPAIGYFGCLARIGTAPSGSRTTLVQLRDAMGLSWWIGLDSGGYPEVGTSLSPTPATATDAIAPGRWVHLGVRFSGGALTLYVDGTAVALVAGAAMTPVRVFVGGTNKPTATGYHHAFTGNVANVALFSTALDATRRAVHGASSDGFAGDTTVERFERVCRVAGLDAADYTTTSSSLTVPPGNSDPTMGEQPTDALPFLDAVQQCADVERGVAFMGGDGVLTLQRGAFRFNQAVALTLAPGDVEPDTSIDDDLTRLVNDLTVTRVGGATQRVVNQASVDEYDTHNDTIEVYAADDGQALAVAEWRVADLGTPQPRVDSVAVDLVAKAGTVDVLTALTVPQSGRVQLSPMPTPESPSSTVDLFADGFTDKVSESSWLRTFATSSATNYSDLWLWDTATEKFDTGGVLY